MPKNNKRSANNQPALINSKTVYESKRLRVEKRVFSQELREENLEVDVVSFPVPRSVAVLPFTEKGEVLLEKHYRYAPLEQILEIPAGWLKSSEKPEDGARRELMEETGYSVLQIKALGTILPAAGYSTEEISLFLARVKKKPESKQSLEPGEKITLVKFSKRTVQRMIRSGKIRDAMTISAVFRAQLRGLF